MDRTSKKWRQEHPQLATCLPRPVYDALFQFAKAQRYPSAAMLVRTLLVDLVEHLGTGDVRQLFRGAVERHLVPVERPATSTLPQLPGIPAVTLQPYKLAEADEPEDITAEARRLV